MGACDEAKFAHSHRRYLKLSTEILTGIEAAAVYGQATSWSMMMDVPFTNMGFMVPSTLIGPMRGMRAGCSSALMFWKGLSSSWKAPLAAVKVWAAVGGFEPERESVASDAGDAR